MSDLSNNTLDHQKVVALGLYFLKNLGKLPKSRFVKLFYLLDWKSALLTGKLTTNLEWYYDHYGPFLPKIIEILLKSGKITIESNSNSMGAEAEYVNISLPLEDDDIQLAESEIKLADQIIEVTRELNFTDFIKLVYSTYPVRSSNKYTKLDLITSSKAYNKTISPVQ